MRIQNNIMAVNAYRNYTANTTALSKNLEKLSSGYAINRAGDDAAGLAISEKMRAQITGLDVAQKNAQDGISLVQTAEGALTEVHDMLNRMVELADQSANGTYDDTDRVQLQKEVSELKNEINRIADSSNFNGINLLDGSMAKVDGVNLGSLSADNIDEVLTGLMGTTGTAVDGVLSESTDEVQYSAKFYVGDVTNSDTGNAKNLELKYKDNTGAEKTITIAITAGGTATTADIAAAILDSGNAHGDVTATDAGTALNGNGTNGGQLKDLYNVTVDGNIITITAKAGDTTLSGTDKIDGSKLGINSIANAGTNGLATSDIESAEAALKQNYGGTGADEIAYGSAAGDATKYVAATEGSYQVASSKLTLDTTKDLHNMAITVGTGANSVTYIIKESTKDLDDATPANGDNNADGGTVKYLEVDDATDTTDVSAKLAAAISKDAGTHGMVATDASGVITISESTKTGSGHLTNETEGKAADLFKLTQYVTTAGQSAVSGDISFDASKLRDGSTLTINGKTYLLSSDPNAKMPGATLINYSKGATSDDIAKAVADQLTKDGVTGVTYSSDGTGKVTFTQSNLSGGITATGVGLVLQIGDTSDSFNQLNVTINDCHTDSMGTNGGDSITDIDISTQDGAKAAIDVIKDAINYVSDVRGTLGATQNRLEHTINNLSVMEENIQNAESAIRDTDVAEEMMAYTKNNILIQSAQAMLAQANQVPQGVLQLLQ